ncbi:MAG: IS1 family transposase [Pyrinomonadaceae bacterium]|nr:IS1 family transposase [Pyrinomonadaceae bacterium]
MFICEHQKEWHNSAKKQRYRCKDCSKQFLTRYTYKAYLSEKKSLIIRLTLNGSGIRDIARVLQISTNTVLSEIRKKAGQISEPRVPKRIGNLEIDEFWSFVEKKKNQRWTWYAFDREKKKVVAFQNGRRTDENCKLLIEKLKSCRVKNYHTDAWEAYQKYLPAENHFISKLGTVNIERNNLNFRTHLKTICFSKNDEMHDAVIKIYVWHSNLKRHHF